MLVDGKWVPTFPKARYLMGRTEFDHWSRARRGERARRRPFSDSVKPVFDAGLVDLVASDQVICPEIRLEPTPGHTPGHVSVRISSKGEEALITGDCMHHPCQMARPDWASAADSDPDAARRTRLSVLDRCADNRCWSSARTSQAPPPVGSCATGWCTGWRSDFPAALHAGDPNKAGL